MISWMQRHNRYLVWTIWVATITFIGAGFVGWGSYSFGSKAGNVAKVGEIEISQNKLNMAYSNLYQQYSERFQGQFDDEKAKEFGLTQQAFATVATQAKVLNFAKENGIVVSDDEVAKYLQQIQIFHENGTFNREYYDRFLTAQRMTAKAFEKSLSEELTISKTLELFNMQPTPFEEEVVSTAIHTADKLSYKVLSANDVNISITQEALKSYWEGKKENFMTQKQYTLSILWTDTKDTEVSEDEIKGYFNENSFNYTDAEGKQLSFDDAKTDATRDLKIQKSKKAAQKAYIALKKGEISATEVLTLDMNDPTLSMEVWEEVVKQAPNEILKPKVVSDRYATIRIDAVIEPKVMSFEQAQGEVNTAYHAQAVQAELTKLAEESLKNFDELNTTISGYISLDQNVNIEPLNLQESLQFIQKVFTSDKETGIIGIADKFVVYKIIDQQKQGLEKDQKEYLKQTVEQLKRATFENNFIKMLDSKYPTEVYVQGLEN